MKWILVVILCGWLLGGCSALGTVSAVSDVVGGAIKPKSTEVNAQVGQENTLSKTGIGISSNVKTENKKDATTYNHVDAEGTTSKGVPSVVQADNVTINTGSSGYMLISYLFGAATVLIVLLCVGRLKRRGKRNDD